MQSLKRAVVHFISWQNKDPRSLKKKTKSSWSFRFYTSLQLLFHINKQFCWDASTYAFKRHLPSRTSPPTACNERYIFLMTFLLLPPDLKLTKEVQLLLIITHRKIKYPLNIQKPIIIGCTIKNIQVIWLFYISRTLYDLK